MVARLRKKPVNKKLFLVFLLIFCGCGLKNKHLVLLSPEEKTHIENLRAKDKNKDKQKSLVIDTKPEKSWGFQWSWDRGVATPGEEVNNSGYDAEGNLIVAPEVYRTYKVPDLHVGTGYDFVLDKLRAFLEVEICEFKTPAGYFPFGFLAGEQFLGFHLSKRWTSILEIETGIFVGQDFDENKTGAGINFFVIKF